MRISFCLITLDEEKNLRRCLKSCVDLADEIIVVDSGSTDRTEAIAREFGARWVHQPWLGYVDQKNKAVSLAANEWVFSIDADEELSPELHQEILSLKETDSPAEASGYSMPRCVFYEGRWIRHGDWYPDRLVRLFRRSQGRFVGAKVHERLVLAGAVQRLQGELRHYSFEDAADHRARGERYARLWAESRLAEGRTAGWFSAYFHAAFRWLRCYVFRTGFLDGSQGRRIALINAQEVFLKYRLLHDLGKNHGASTPIPRCQGDPMPVTWLILSYFSNIDGMATAQHLDDRIPHLKELGIKPVLLSSVCGEPLCDVVHARVPCVAPSGIRFEARHWLRRGFSQGWQRKFAGLLISLPCLPFYLLEKLAVNLDSQWSWFFLAAIRGYGLCRKHRASVIYSTGGAPSAHLAAAILSRWTRLPWIAEFQDPLVYPGLRRSRRAIRLYSWLEKLVGRRATWVVFLTEGARLRFAERTGTDSNGIAIYPGSNPDKVPSVPWQKGNACRFAHVGTLAGTRNLKTFFQVLSELFQESPTWLEKVEVHLYGHMDRAMRDLIRDFPHPGVVKDHGRLPRGEVLSAMAQSDVLLLVQNADPISEQTIPSKLYEYWLTGRPVLALTHGNRELTAMLNERGHFAAEVGQVSEIRRTLMQVLTLWTQNLADWQPVRHSPFTVQAAVSKLANLPQASSTHSNPAVSETHASS